MIRIDKLISNQTNYSRKEIKNLIKQKRIKINNIVIDKSDIKVEENKDIILVDDKELTYKKYVYLILNKPKGYISSTEDKINKTVIDLVPEKYQHRNLFPAGRLDKDTTGLILITDDGAFAHNILSPKKHIKKTYKVVIDKEITEEMIDLFKRGLPLKDEICKEAVLEKIDSNTGIVILTEGKYHQIKRMFKYFDSEVIELQRIGLGNYYLTNNFKEKECKELTEEELNLIQCK